MPQSKRSKASLPYRQPPTPVQDDALRRRLWGVGLVIVAGFSLLLARAWHLQVMQGEYFLNLSEQNRIRDRRIKSLRGKILDRYGRVLATNRPAYAVMAMP